jgi:hypothetical protein
MVDERSGMVYGEAVINHPKHVLLNTFKNAYNFYLNYFKIIRTRTDHALDFKRTEALRTGEFNDLIVSLWILHQYSFLNEPETNGKVENLHKQIDKELLSLVNKCDTVEDALTVINY